MSGGTVSTCEMICLASISARTLWRVCRHKRLSDAIDSSAGIAVDRYFCDVSYVVTVERCYLKNTLNPYAGPLTPAQVAQGISAAQENARRLLEDAKLLLDAGRLPSAAALAILSIEERGKTIVLKRLALVSDPADLKKTWSEYRSHRAKNTGWIIPQLVNEGVRTMHGMAPAVDPNAEHAGLLDALKQISLYSDCLGQAHWSVPNEIIDEALVQSLMSSAEMMWGGRSVTTREIQLWAEIVGPHYNRSRMREAIVQWQHAMVAEGLSDTPPETLEAFMRGEPIDVGQPDAKDATPRTN